MYYREVQQDLFSVGDEYTLIQCISGDFALNKGLALEMQKKFAVRTRLQSKMRPFTVPIGHCVYTEPVLNIVTEGYGQNKPTYETMYEGLFHLREAVEKLGIEAIAMPLLGCGLGQLKWPIVRALIKDIFEDTDIEILVCYLEG